MMGLPFGRLVLPDRGSNKPFLSVVVLLLRLPSLFCEEGLGLGLGLRLLLLVPFEFVESWREKHASMLRYLKKPLELRPSDLDPSLSLVQLLTRTIFCPSPFSSGEPYNMKSFSHVYNPNEDSKNHQIFIISKLLFRLLHIIIALHCIACMEI